MEKIKTVNVDENITEIKPVLELANQDGNAFAILGRAKKVAKESGWSKDKIECFLTEAKSGDYDNLLAICIRYFDVQ